MPSPRRLSLAVLLVTLRRGDPRGRPPGLPPHLLLRSVGGGVPTPRLYALLVTFRRGRSPHRPAWICTALLAACHCEPVTDVTGVAIRVPRLKPPLRKGRWREAPEGSPTAPLVPAMPTAWYFLPPAAESTQRTPPKPMVLDSLHGRGTSCAETLLPRESNGRNPAPCFRIVPASISVQKRLRAGTDLPELQSTLHPLPFRRGRRPNAPFARTSCYIS